MKNVAKREYPNGGRAKINGFYEYIGKRGEKVSGSRSFVAAFQEITEKAEERERLWVEGLRAMGVSAAHPDDGWHNREEKFFQLAYPCFNEGIEVGSQVALGDADEYLVVKIREKRKGMFSSTKFFY